MTAHKSFKRLVRARMAKTGESYTAARARLLAVPDEPMAGHPLAPLACSDDRIRERTGRGWEEWFDLLDSWGADTMSHTDIARRVAELRGIPVLAWDAQAVTTSFERARGARVVGERAGGRGMVATASKTLAVSDADVFWAFVDPSQRAGWLPDLLLSERTVSKPKSARFDVGDGTRLLVTVEAKGPGRSTVAVEHSHLADAAQREARAAYWRLALLTLKAQLEDEALAPIGGRS